MIIDIIAGARPNFVKISAIINEFKKHKKFKKHIIRLIHTGQHYDKNMSDVFFKQLKIKKPDINFKSGSGSYAKQISKIMISYENLLNKKKSTICIVVGDVNSTLACSLIAKQNNIKVVHIEAGIRSDDLTMPEEINRIITDSITDFYFTTSRFANKNLKKLGVNKNRIFFVGNTMIDTLKSNLNNLKKPKFYDKLLKKNNFILLTIHRPSNTNKLSKLIKLLKNISKFSRNLPIILPAHPRLKKKLSNFNTIPDKITILDPLSYFEFIYLLKNCKIVITDSGGITEEATYLKKPCITLRDNTERPETLLEGSNVLVGDSIKKLGNAFKNLYKKNWKKMSVPNKWDGKSAYRIIKILDRILN